MENISQMSLIEVAVALMEQKRTPQNINSLIKEVLEMKGLDENDVELKTQLYVDLIASSKFVYMGNDEWDLKIRHSLDQFDKDGSAFNSKDDEYIEEDEIEVEADEDDTDDEDFDDDLDDEDEDDDDEESEGRDVASEYVPEEDETDDFDEADDDSNEHYDEDFDEDKYNDYMDDFENMYED